MADPISDGILLYKLPDTRYGDTVLPPHLHRQELAALDHFAHLDPAGLQPLRRFLDRQELIQAHGSSSF